MAVRLRRPNLTNRANSDERAEMPDGAEPITVKVLDSIHDVPATAWDACAGTDNPFLTHAFLAALEFGRFARKRDGCRATWPVSDADGRLLAAMPLYLKGHSYGEYVFDWSWAEAYERAGGRYYLSCRRQFRSRRLPAGGLWFARMRHRQLSGALAAAAVQVAERLGVSSLHVTFPTEDEITVLQQSDFMIRLGYQFHWGNRGYASFDDFLSDLASPKRKAVRKGDNRWRLPALRCAL